MASKRASTSICSVRCWKARISVGALDVEVLGDLAAVHHRAHRNADIGGPWRRQVHAAKPCLVVACAITPSSFAP